MKRLFLGMTLVWALVAAPSWAQVEDLKSEDPKRRAKAAEELGKQKDTSSIESLRGALKDPDRNVRAEVPPQDDALAQQARNHRISRLTSAVQVVQFQMTSR